MAVIERIAAIEEVCYIDTLSAGYAYTRCFWSAEGSCLLNYLPIKHEFITPLSLLQGILTMLSNHDKVYSGGEGDATFPGVFGIPVSTREYR